MFRILYFLGSVAMQSDLFLFVYSASKIWQSSNGSINWKLINRYIRPFLFEIMTWCLFDPKQISTKPMLNNIHYRQKIWNIFHFSDFVVFCEVCWVYLYLIDIPTNRYNFWGVNSHSLTKWTAKVQKQLFWSFFFIRRWLEFLLSHCQIVR